MARRVVAVTDADGGAWQPPALPRRLTDPVLPVLTAAGLWAVALVVLLVLGGPAVWVWACLVGIGLAGVGLGVLALQRRASARGARSAQNL